MGIKKIAVRHKREDCIGCGSCALIASQQWKIDDADGKATLIGSSKKGSQFMVGYIDEDTLPENKEAAQACPVAIIHI